MSPLPSQAETEREQARLREQLDSQWAAITELEGLLQQEVEEKERALDETARLRASATSGLCWRCQVPLPAYATEVHGRPLAPKEQLRHPLLRPAAPAGAAPAEAADACVPQWDPPGCAANLLRCLHRLPPPLAPWPAPVEECRSPRGLSHLTPRHPPASQAAPAPVATASTLGRPLDPPCAAPETLEKNAAEVAVPPGFALVAAASPPPPPTPPLLSVVVGATVGRTEEAEVEGAGAQQAASNGQREALAKPPTPRFGVEMEVRTAGVSVHVLNLDGRRAV